MKTIMLLSFFTFDGMMMEPVGTSQKAYETLDDCIYELVEAQELNEVTHFVLAGCIEQPEGS